MTRAELEARRRSLETGIAILRAQIADDEEILQKKRTNLAATVGAMQECEYWLGRLPAGSEPDGQLAEENN
jgi:hypothetical protein